MKNNRLGLVCLLSTKTNKKGNLKIDIDSIVKEKISSLIKQ